MQRLDAGRRPQKDQIWIKLGATNIPRVKWMTTLLVGYLPTERDEKLNSTRIRHGIKDKEGTDETFTWEHDTYRKNASDTPETQRRTNEFETRLGSTNKYPW